jgi:hypothetical protein
MTRLAILSSPNQWMTENLILDLWVPRMRRRGLAGLMVDVDGIGL